MEVLLQKVPLVAGASGGVGAEGLAVPSLLLQRRVLTVPP